MTHDGSFDGLMAGLRAGDEGAAREVFNRFTRRLLALARARLAGRLRAKVDPEDVLQSVYKSFFRRQAQGDFAVDGWDGLWGLLTVITLRKCGRWVKHFHTARRDLGAEAGAAWEALAREPTPPEAALLAEAVEQLLRGLDERERAIVTLALQGADVAEISTQVGRTRRTVQRVLRRVRDELRRS